MNKQNNKVIIRKAKKEDFREIAVILKEESAKKPYNEKYTLPIAVKEVKDCAKEDLYIAVDHRKIIGFIASHITPDNKRKSYIRELWLRQEDQGKGIGKALVSFIEEMYKKKGIKIIRLVTKKKSNATRFYNKLKYKETTGLVFLEKKLK